jgi:hypothetical protein
MSLRRRSDASRLGENRRVRRRALSVLAALLLLLPATASSRKRTHRKSPHAEILAAARVETAPQRTRHKNRREFEEFDVTLLSAEHVDQGDSGGDPTLSIDTRGRVHVVHDLSCGGNWLDAKPGDRIELKGEYVHRPRGPDLIHFTHPANAGRPCGRRASHPDGFVRLLRPAAEALGETPAADLFAAAVRPVLARRCAPCHEKGGKMYARLPFDDPSVVSSHAPGARKRLKGDDLATLERWLATLPELPSQPQAPRSY